ncbi:hypothetical protein WJX77_012405 [Trebouxia sp. C0004]
MTPCWQYVNRPARLLDGVQSESSAMPGRQISYFISPHAQNMVRAAVFYIVDDEDDGVGVGVFFSRSTAVTADHNLTVDQVLGTKVLVKIPELQEQLTMVVHARHPEMDYALLQCDTDHAYLPVYHEPPEQLLGADLVLAGYRIGIEEYTPMFSRSRKFNSGVGSLSPKGKPNLLLEDDDVVAGGVTYVFTPSAGSQGISGATASVDDSIGFEMRTLSGRRKVLQLFINLTRWLHTVHSLDLLPPPPPARLMKAFFRPSPYHVNSNEEQYGIPAPYDVQACMSMM